MKVLIISPCMGRYGGLEGFVLALAKGIRPDPDLSLDLVFKQAAGFELGSDLKRRIAESQVDARFCRKASPELFRAVRHADVVHVQNPCPDVVSLAIALRKRVLINVINHAPPGRSLHVLLWKLCLRLGHRRFYISDFVRRTWENSAQAWRGSRVVFPICDLAAQDPLPAEQRRGFVFVARWIENKGLDLLVEAYARAGLDPREWPLQLLGDGPLRQKIEARVGELGLQGVEMPGFTSEQEKGGRIRRSRFVVIPPNTNEDFGLVAIEARHLGVPCLITRDGGVPEAAGKHSLSCAPGDVDGLTALLRQAAAMPDADYHRLASAAHTTLEAELVRPEFYQRTYREMWQPRAADEKPCG